jgi:hypothetical protein
VVSATGQGDLGNALNSTQATVLHATQLVVDGKVYNSIEELPPEIRERYLKAMQPFDTNQNGIPDLLEGGGFAGTPRATLAGRTPDAPSPSAQPNLVTVVGEGPKVSAMLLVAGVSILILLGVVGYFLVFR